MKMRILKICTDSKLVVLGSKVAIMLPFLLLNNINLAMCEGLWLKL